MPKTYSVNGTDYEFPDTIDDNKAHSILVNQGIIKPPPPQMPVPSGLKENTKSAWEDPTNGFIGQGVRQMGRGVASLASPGGRMSGASDILEGAGRAALPAAIPLAVASPLSALGGAAAGTAGSMGGEALTRKMGGGAEAQRLAGNLGGFAAGGAGSSLGAAAERGLAVPLAKTALRLPGKADAYGATPAKALLEETQGVRPSTIQVSAQKRIADLTSEQDSAARASTTPGSLLPARQVVNDAMSKAAGRNSTATPAEALPMQRFLNEPAKGFKGATTYPPGSHTPISFAEGPPSPILSATGQPIPGPTNIIRGASPSRVVAPDQSASDLLGMRRQFDQDFIRNWNPTANTKGALGTARNTYRALGREVDKAIPGGAERDQRIQSLIPVEQGAKAASLSPTLGQRVLSRVARPTGGMVPALIGLREGGPLGAAAGLTAAEAAASPVPLMIGARGLHGAGKITVPPVLHQPLTRNKRERE